MTDTPSPTEPKAVPQKDEIKETIRTIVIAMVIALTIRTFAFEPFNIPSGSMIPTLLIGDYLFVSKYAYGYGSTGTFWNLPGFRGRIGGHEPHRGDVIVFKVPYDNTTDYIKRLIGLPGDTIQMRQGILYINNLPIERDRLVTPVVEPGHPAPDTATDYLEHLPGGVTHVIREEGDEMPLDNTEIFTVPAHHYFFMGDNRDNSADSRTVRVRYVPEENLVGKAEFLFFSLDEGARFWQLWKWPSAVRWHRLFTKIS